MDILSSVGDKKLIEILTHDELVIIDDDAPTGFGLPTDV